MYLFFKNQLPGNVLDPVQTEPNCHSLVTCTLLTKVGK